MWPGGRYEVLLIDEFGPNNSTFAVYYVKEKALVSGRVASWNAGPSGLMVSRFRTDIRNVTTNRVLFAERLLLNLDLTVGLGAPTLKRQGFEDSYGFCDRRPAEYGNPAGKASAQARPVRQVAALDHSAGDDRGSPDLCAFDGELLDEPA